MSRSAPSLSELQALMQSSIMTGNEEILSLIPPSSRATAETLLGVYQHAYLARLVGAVENDYENLAAYVGDEQFDTLARAFLAKHPSQTPNARWVGHGLPDYLSQEIKAHPELGELAAIERALNDAFDAPDAPELELGALTAIEPEQWGNITFTVHPATQTLRQTTNAWDIWHALRNEETPPEPSKHNTPATILVWRHQATPMTRTLVPEEAMMWIEATRGQSFGTLCELLATYDEPETAPLRAAGYLQTWLSASLLAAIETKSA